MLHSLFAVLLASFLDTINPVKWVSYIVQGAFTALKRFICWFILLALDWCSELVAMLLSFVPSPPAYFADLLNWFGIINSWVPVDTFLWCGFTYFTFTAGIAGFRLVKSFIPTISG